MAYVRNPVVYVPDLTNGRPIVDGKVYLLTSGTIPPMHDSTIDPTDLLTVTYINEAGNTVEQPQPLYTSKGGCLYGNFPDAARQFMIAPQAYVFAAYNRIGELQYSAETSASDYVETDALAAVGSTVLIGGIEARLVGANFETVADMVSYSHHSIGKHYSTRATEWQVVDDFGISVGGGLYVRAATDIVASDYMTAAEYEDAESGTPTLDTTSQLQQATDDAYLCKCNVVISTVFLLKGSGGLNTGRLTDGVDIKSGVSYYAARNGEVRLDLSCVIGFAYRPHVAITSLNDAPKDVNFYGIKFTRPGSTWDVALENTAILYIASVNNHKVINCQFIGWVGDAIYYGINDNSSLSAILETYVKNVEVSGCLFDGVNNGNRQAISILDGIDIIINNNIFQNCTRSATPNPMPGAIDIEPILSSAKLANIIIEGNTFDGVGGATGVVSAALSHPLTSPAHDIRVRFNTFRNTKAIADFYAFGPTSTDHLALPANAPYGISFSDNYQEDLPSGVQNRRWFCGGVRLLNIDRNEVIGGSDTAIIGYDDGANKWPVETLSLQENTYKNWAVNGADTTPVIGFFGGLIGATISDNTSIDCGNLAPTPVNMTVYGFIGNGRYSKNVVIESERFTNNGAYSVSSHPFYAAVLDYASTFTVQNVVYNGIDSTAYTYAFGIYNKAKTDYLTRFVTQPSTNTPVVAGLSRIVGSTGDTWLNFSGGQDGQLLTVLALSSGVTIQNNADIKTKTGANVVLAAGGTMALVYNASKWYEI